MPTSTPASALLDALAASGALLPKQRAAVEEEHARTGVPVEAILVQKKFADDETVTKARGEALGIPYADLIGKDIPAAVINLIPRQTAETTKAVAFASVSVSESPSSESRIVSIGMVDPADAQAAQAIDFLSQNVGFTPKYHIITQASYASAFKKYEALSKEVERALEAAKEKYVPVEKAAERVETLEEVIKGAPVSRIVSVILRHAVEAGASDIHIEPHGNETRVRYRIDGVLRTTLALPKYVHASIVSRVKVLADLKLDETRIPQDGRITETFNGKVIDFRVSTLPLSETEKVVMRILDTTRGVPTLEQLGFRKEYVDVIKEEIRKPHGLFLISGPTGSGKSTTLFTVMSMRNEEGVNISTLEDPIEYYIKGVNQSQVRPEVGFTFASGLRALLRQDPNIIMVGEIRDGETGELAVHAALTGHLIFSTVHTNDAIGVVPRLVDMKVEPFLLAATINLAIAQRLARRICDRCKTTVELPTEVEAAVRAELAELPEKYRPALDASKPLTLFKGRGCLRCADSGYVGRVACAEMMAFDQEMRDLVATGFPADKVRQVVAKQGMITLRQDAILKAVEGWTTLEEVLRISSE